MKRQTLTLTVAALFALGVGTAWAQRPTQDSGPSRPSDPTSGRGVGGGAGGAGGSDSGSTTSTTVGTATSSTGGSTQTTTSSGSTGGGGNSVGWGDRPGLDFPRADAPRRGPGAARAASFSDDGGQRPRGGAPSQGTAAPRGTPSGGGGGGGGEGRAVPRGSGGDSGNRGGRATPSIDGGGDDHRGPQRSAVPAYSRPREGRTPIGSPVERGTASGRPIYPTYPYYPYYPYYPSYPYYGYGYYSRYGLYPGFGFGLGYFYDPFWYGGAYGGYGGYYGGGYGGGAGYYQTRGYDTGNLRLKVQPRDAKVFIDGYFVGVVDSFDGVFQKVAVEAGSHRVEIRADGFEPAQFEVMVTPGETITYKGQLKPITP